jgi:hypothetical protein
VDAAETVERRIRLSRDASVFAAGEDGGKPLDDERGVGEFGGREIELVPR